MPRKVPPKELFAKAEEKAEIARNNFTRVNWSECSLRDRGFEASKATTLSPAVDADYLLRKAFQKFDLDPANPWAWRTLLYLLAKLHFGETKEWDENRLALLKVRCEQYPGTNTDKIKQLRNDYKEDYEHIGSDRYLRELLERAQKPI
jgi:hypothetical protein